MRARCRRAAAVRAPTPTSSSPARPAPARISPRARCISSAAAAAPFRRHRLPRAGGEPARGRALRPRAWRVHGRTQRGEPLRAGRRGHGLSRSRGRAVARRPGQAAAPRRAETGGAARSTVAVPIRARVVASAADGIEAAVRDGRFRMDLYHRLRVLPIRIPPLRQRAGDVPVLARRLMTELTNGAGSVACALTRVRWRSSPPTIGPATSASCATSSNAR